MDPNDEEMEFYEGYHEYYQEYMRYEEDRFFSELKNIRDWEAEHTYPMWKK